MNSNCIVYILLALYDISFVLLPNSFVLHIHFIKKLFILVGYEGFQLVGLTAVDGPTVF